MNCYGHCPEIGSYILKKNVQTMNHKNVHSCKCLCKFLFSLRGESLQRNTKREGVSDGRTFFREKMQ